MSASHHAEAYDLMDALWPLASKAKTGSAYWISTPNGEHNGNEWCFTCGRAKVRHLRKKDRKNRQDYILDGGWATEHDTPPHCASCGVKLRADLTVHGGLYELDHFSESPPVPGNVDHAYEVREMLSALSYTGPDHDEAAKEAIAIARTLVDQMARSS